MSQGPNLVIGASGQGTAPTSGTAIATLALPTESNDVQPSFDSSKWRVDVNAVQAGTVDTANLTSLTLDVGTAGGGYTAVGNVMCAGSPFTVTFPAVFPGKYRFTDGTCNLRVRASANFGAGAIVAAVIVATREG